MQYLTPRSVALYPSASPIMLRLVPRRILFWNYTARIAVTSAIFLAAALTWGHASRADTLIASLLFALVMTFTGASAFYTHVYRRPIVLSFVYAQAIFDLVVVTTIVHVTWESGASLFAPLYILIIAVSALLLPAKGVSLISALGITLYGAEIFWIRDVPFDLSVVLQLVIFGVVAIGSGYIAARLREAGVGKQELVEELTRFRLREADVERLHLRAERLEAIAEMSASMAHEIKNPLASIRSAVEQIAMAPRTTDDERTLTTLVQREADRLSRLLTSFLDFARVDVPYTKRLDVVDVVRQAAELADAHPDKPAGARVQYDFPRGELAVLGDEDMLHRAFFNLVLNALQASPPDTTVRVEAATLLPHQVDATTPAFARGAIAIRVIDQGPGVPEELKEKLFHPFFTTKKNGNGLGLAIVHRSIEAHHGVVVVDSDELGSRFTVLLPIL